MPLTELSRYERAAAEGTLPELIVALEQAARSLPADAELGEVFTLFARALRMDLAFLVAHPEEVFTRLYARCRFEGSAEQEVLRTTAPGEPVPPFAPKRSAVGALLERWASERNASGRPWLRLLRPAEREGLSGPLRELYRRAVGRRPAQMRIDDEANTIYLKVCQRRWEPTVSEPRVLLEWRMVGWDRTNGWAFEGETLTEPDTEHGVFVSPDGRVRVEAKDWGQCRLVETATGEELALFPVPHGRIWDAHFFEDGARVVMVGHNDEDGADRDDGLVMVFDLRTRTLVRRIVGGSTVYHVTASKSGRLLALGDSRNVVVWEWETERLVAVLPGGASLMAFSSDERTLFTENDNEVRVWDLARAPAPRREQLLRAPWVENAAFSPDGETLLLGAWLCDARTGRPRAQLAHWFGEYLEGGPARDAFRMTDERVILLAECVNVWNARDGSHLIDGRAQLPAIHHVHWHLIAISADGRSFAKTRSCDRSDASPKEVVLYELEGARELARFEIPGASAVALSADGARLAAGSPDGKVRIWDATSGALLSSFDEHRHLVSGVAFLRGDDLVVSGAEDDAICVWEALTGLERLRRELPADAPHYDFWSATEGGGRRRYWRATPAAIAEIEEEMGLRPPGHPWRLALEAGWLQIVHARTGQVAGTLPTSVSLVPHPDGPIFAGEGLHFVVAGDRE